MKKRKQDKRTKKMYSLRREAAGKLMSDSRLVLKEIRR